ncbi:hypothetical protein [Schlesneria paludicola]|uniref:hypothetical protein n=1 Tax=Schlesneria paludicola TaxID=360056 RepID=UPI00029AEE58|nr:hypothetical protein [Schlesneria paludicola]
MKKAALKNAPKVDRFEKSTDKSASSRIDREGGRYSAGVIYGVSLCSRGEALGHCMWVDNVMLQQIVDLSPTDGPRLLKSRFMHPDLCNDGMGKALGTIENLKLLGDQVYGDLHFYGAAHAAPDGNLADYVMTLAEEDPANFGTSIVFQHDWEAEELFRAENMQETELTDEDGNVVETRSQFVSPDPLNVENYRHARISQLSAADVVDEPAANPNGLFHREHAFLQDGVRLLDFVLGRSTELPALSALGADVHPDRVKSFVSKYLARAGLTVGEADSEGEGTMPSVKGKGKKLSAVEDPKDEKKPDESKPGDAKPEGKPPEGDAEPDDDDETKADDEPVDDEEPMEESDDEDGKDSKETKQSDPTKKELAKFCKAFGHEAGSKYFLDAVSFEAAQGLHITALTAERDAMKQKLDAFAASGIEPLNSRVADQKSDKPFRAASGSEQEGEIYDPREAFAKANSSKSA